MMDVDSMEDIELKEAELLGVGDQDTYDDSFFASGLPDTRIKRNYGCNRCGYHTTNPRNYLHHCRDVHGDKMRIYECPKCIYASKHLQKLQRHITRLHDAMESNNSAIESNSSYSSPMKISPAESPQEFQTKDGISTSFNPMFNGFSEFKDSNEVLDLSNHTPIPLNDDVPVVSETDNQTNLVIEPEVVINPIEKEEKIFEPEGISINGNIHIDESSNMDHEEFSNFNDDDSDDEDELQNLEMEEYNKLMDGVEEESEDIENLDEEGKPINRRNDNTNSRR